MYDSPQAAGIAYLVCATQRSGSTLLCELLKGTEVAGVPEEYFEGLRATGLPRQPHEYFAGSALADIADSLGPDFPDLRIVFARRRNKVEQAVSLWKAIQTQQWRNEASESESREIRYDYRAIKHLLDQLHRWDANWEDWFHATGREPIRVIYEEFVSTRAATVGRVLDGLGIDPPEAAGDKGPMRRQQDDQSKAWIDRFRDDDDRDLSA